MAVFTVNGNANNFTGTASADTFRGFSGGLDNLRGMAGNDRFEINNWSQQRGRIDGGVGTDRIVMTGHNNHTFNTQLTIVGVEELWADRLFASVVQIKAFSKFVPTNDESTWFIDIMGAGGTLDFTGKYTSAKRMSLAADNAESRVIVTGSGKGDDFLGSDFADVWIGGAGADLANGIGGNDIFRFKALSDSTVAAPDKIQDFDFDGNDKIDVSALYGPALVYRGTAAFTKVGQLRIVDVGGDVVVQVNTVGGPGADFAIRLTTIEPSVIGKDDFIL